MDKLIRASAPETLTKILFLRQTAKLNFAIERGSTDLNPYQLCMVPSSFRLIGR